MITRDAFNFFRRHAGGIVGQNALGALHLARAEEYAQSHDWVYLWEHDPNPGLSWCACADGKVTHSHEVLCCLLKNGAGEVLGALGGVVDADRAYGRVVEAELALDAYPDAIQAERDAAKLESRRDRQFPVGPDRFNLYSDDTLADVTYGRWSEARDGAYALVPYCSGSDYSGTLVERSNHDAWSEQFSDGQGDWWDNAPGGHRTFTIVVEIARMPEDAIEFVEGLQNYCVADDDAHSRLEMEAQDEAWESCYRRDFARAIAARFNVDDVDLDVDETREMLFTIFRESADHANEYWENQSGSDMYINLDRVVRSVTAEDFEQLCSALPGPQQLALKGIG